MDINVVSFKGKVVLVYEGTFEECILKLEQYFGKCTGWNLSGSAGTLSFPKGIKFDWTIKEKNILIWDMEWGTP